VTTNQREYYAAAERASRAAGDLRGPARARAVHASLSPDAPPGTACSAGCSHCCRFPVGVRFAEAALLAETVARDPDLRARVLDDAAASDSLDWADLTGRPCPLLVDGRCAAYEDRPTPCRALRSFDAARCERALTAPTEVPRDEQGWWRGLGAASVLDELPGPRELRSALAALLQDETAAVAADRPTAFAAARPVPDACA
jgi:hypothetical protein